MKNKNKLVILSILFTTNNVLYTLATADGKVLFWTSVGSKKSSGVKKTASISVLTTTKEIINYLSNFDYKYICIKIKGFNKNKKLVIKYLLQSSFNVSMILDETSFPHNGCKQSKK